MLWREYSLSLTLFYSFSLSEDPAQIGKGVALITVLDINDNAPIFAIDYETLLCENAMPGQVRPRNVSEVRFSSSLLPFFFSPHTHSKLYLQRQPADSQSH